MHNGAKEQARYCLESISSLILRVDHSRSCNGGEECILEDHEIAEGLGFAGPGVNTDDIEEYHDEDMAYTTLMEDPLEVSVRSGWYSPGAGVEEQGAELFRIILCTGGPHVEIRGELRLDGTPARVTLFYLWGSESGYYPLTSDEEDVLYDYCMEFLVY